MHIEKIKTYMFHYIRDSKNNELSYLNSFNSEKFFSFVDKNKNNILSQKCIKNLLSSGDEINTKRKILLTFDDGLKDHFNEAYRILKSFNLSGIFFINTKNIIFGEMDTVHKMHFLYGKIGWKKLVEIIIGECRNKKIKIEDYYDEEIAAQSYPLDDREVAVIKYAINYKLQAKIRDELVNSIFYDYRGDFEEKNFYLSKNDINEMSSNGMIFGFHGHEHIPFSSLNKYQLHQSLLNQKIFFEDMDIKNYGVLSFPYGDISSYNHNNINVLTKFGLNLAFIADQHNVNNHSLKILKRIDCAAI